MQFNFSTILAVCQVVVNATSAVSADRSFCWAILQNERVAAVKRLSMPVRTPHNVPLTLIRQTQPEVDAEGDVGRRGAA